MFRRLVIANRGEIALRIVRTCKEMGIETAVICSDVDRDSAAARAANHVIPLGDPWCYLDGERIITAAREWDADALHPGYGFLAENPRFARQCAEAGIVFIGPNADVMQHLGEKDRARASAMALGIPCLPGTEQAVADEDAAVAMAEEIGYPVLIKAVAGGGGRGMRLAGDEAELRAQLPRAMSEAEAAFKSSAVYLEKFLTGARHVEVQVLADSTGNVVHLGERDCTVQRRHQKLIEEAPSPAVNDELRAAMGDAATRLLASVNYVNAGTVEFLVDDEGNYFFLEVNTRVQVEHPVTELLYGVDIIAEQIRIAAGRPLSFRQDELIPRGWAIECRINAEDPTKGFAPKPGKISRYLPPAGPGVRVDSAAFTGWSIPPFYDSMIAKVIVWAPDREAAVARMERALQEFLIEGVPTTIPFHLAVLAHEDFRSGRIDTRFAETSISAEDVRAMAERIAEAEAKSAAEAQPGPAAEAVAESVAEAVTGSVAKSPSQQTPDGERGGADGAAVKPAAQGVHDAQKSGANVEPGQHVEASTTVHGQQDQKGQQSADVHGQRPEGSSKVAAIAAAITAATDRPHRLVSISPAPPSRPAGFWGIAGRLDQMRQRLNATNPRRDRRT